MQMKKVLSILLVAVMLFSAIPFTAFATDSGVWQECSSGDIANGDTVIVTMTNASDATFGLYNSNGSSSAPTAVALAISNDGKLTGSDSDLSNCTWTVGRDGDAFTFSHGGDSLFCNSTNNGVRVGGDNNTTFTIDSNYLKNSGTGRYVGVYNGQDWRCYTTINNNIKNQTLKFWKYVQGTTEPTEPEPTEPEPKVATVTWQSSLLNSTDGDIINSGVKMVSTERVGRNIYDYSSTTFSTLSGADFTKIEITKSDGSISGWTESGSKLTWTGNANTVTFTANVFSISQIVFTIAIPEFDPTAGYSAFVPTDFDDAEILAAKVVNFGGYEWYLIADNSTSATEGTVTLLSKGTMGSSVFNDDSDKGNAYSGSTVEQAVEAIVNNSFAAVADAIATVDLEDVNVTGAKLWLLSTTEAQALPSAVRNIGSYWWLRTPGSSDTTAACVYKNNGNVNANGSSVTYTDDIRPALKLDLSKIEFDAETKTFSLSANAGTVYDSGTIDDFSTLNVGDYIAKGIEDAWDSEYSVVLTGGTFGEEGRSFRVYSDNYNFNAGEYGMGTYGSHYPQPNVFIEDYNENLKLYPAVDGVEANAFVVVAKDDNQKTITFAGANTPVVIATYTVTWKNGDTTIETDSHVEAGTIPTFNSATPADYEDAEYTYTFSGWSDGTNTYGLTDTLPAVSGDVTYTAVYTQTAKHFHAFTYSANGATITAECSSAGCDLTEGKVTLTISAPALTTYGSTESEHALLTGADEFNAATGKAVAQTDVKYVGRDGTEYEESATAPTNGGKYTAKITVEEQTASVDYEIANPDYTITTPADLVGGSVVADKATAKFGEEVTLTVTPDSAYKLGSLTVKDAGNNALTVTNGKFKMPLSNVTVSAEFVKKSLSSAVLTVTGNGGTASLMNASFAALDSTDKIMEGEKFVVSVNKDDKHEFNVTLSAGNDESIQEFTSADYEAYLAFAEENGIFVSSDTALFWVTVPCIDNQDLTVTVTFVEIKTYTVLYQHAADTNPDAVFCKISRTVQGQNDIKYALMKSGATIGDTAVWSLTITSTLDPSQVTFVAANKPFASDLSTTLENAAMSTATVSQTSDSWANIAGGKYLIVGGNAKLVAAAFVSDASAMAVYGNNSFEEAASTAGVKYQFAVCPTDNEGNVTAASTVKAPAAPSKDGFDFAGWRGFEGTAPNKTEKIYQVGDSISISDNTILNAVWNRKNLSITFNLNGGTGGMNNTSVTYGSVLTIAQNPTRNGYAFNGWAVGESVTENGVFFAKGSAFDLNTPITANLKLTAQWKHVHSYTGFRVTRFSSLSKYHKYDSAVHVAVCGCGDVQLLAHEFNANGKCSCGYQKAMPPTATLYVSYGQWSNGTYTEKMQGMPETVKKGQEVSISAPGYWGSLQFSKWQYSAGDGKWLDLTADAYASFLIPCTLYVRALYINPITAPQIELSARHYDDQAVVNDKTYTMGNILFQMNYKLPDGCTFVDGGIKMGDNSGISYYFIQEVRVAYDNECKGIIAGLGVGMGALSGLVSGGGALTTFIDIASTMNDTGVYYNYLETEDNVLEKEMDAATLAQYMYEGKPVNIEKYDPIYWGADVQTKGMSGSVATIPPLRFAQKNNQNHYIYGIGWMRYKDSNGNIKTIYTDALAATVNNVPANPVIKTGESSLKAVANLASGKKLAGLNRGLVPLGNTSTDENTNVDVIFSTDIQLNTYVDGTWNAGLSGGYGFGDTATVTAPDIAGKSFSHWEADGSIISYSKTLKLTMNAHTALYAVYADNAPTAKDVAGFTSITRTNDGKISFQAIANGTDAGIIYSTTASGNELVIGGSGVTNVAAASLTDETVAMPESILDNNNCWMLKITPDSADTVYHARTYVTVGGETTYGDVKDVKLSDLHNGISLVANLDGFEPENNLNDTLSDITAGMHTITWKNGDGSVIDTTIVEDGETPTHAAPADYEDADYTYTFAGWTPDVVAATADATYTATFTATPKPHNAVNLTVGEDITSNYYVDYKAYGDEARYVHYTYNCVSEQEQYLQDEVTIDLTEAGALEGLTDAQGRFVITVSQAPAQMAEPTVIEILDANNQVIETLEYSAKIYCDTILAMSDEELETRAPGKVEELRALCNTMIAYGEAAQGVFTGYQVTDATKVTCQNADVNAQIDAASYTPNHTVDNSGMIKFTSVSFVCAKDARIRVYLDTSAATSTPAAPTASRGGAALGAQLKYTQSGGSKTYFVEVSDIDAVDFDKPITINYGGSSITISVLDFAGIVLANSSDDAMQHFAKTLIVYNENAKAFFGS